MNRSEIIRFAAFLRSLHGKYETPTELRVIRKNPDDPKRSKGVVRHFSTTQSICDFIENYDGDDSTNFYAVLNPVEVSTGAGDSNVKAVCWLPLDIDPIRRERDSMGELQALLDQKCPSSDEELEDAKRAGAALEKAITTSLPDSSPCLTGISGNGFHLLYRVEGFKSVEEGSEAIKGVLDRLQLIFRQDSRLRKFWVDVDTVVANPSRVWKFYGTVGKKGVNSPERPWRTASIDKLRDPLEHTPLRPDDVFKLIADLQTYIEKNIPTLTRIDDRRPNLKPTVAPDGWNGEPTGSLEWTKDFAGIDLLSTNIVAACVEKGLTTDITEFSTRDSDGNDHQLVCVRCPNESNHSCDTGTRQTAIMLPAGRSFANFRCLHDHCAHLTGAETAYRMLGVDLVRKHSRQNAPVVPTLETPKTQEADLLEIKLPPKAQPEDEQPRPDIIGPDEQPEPESIELDWMRSLQDILVEPDPKDKREILVQDLIKRGEIMTVQAPTKVGKTFQLTHMALAWSHGLDYLGFKPTKNLKVLIIDPELFKDEGEFRLRWVAENVLMDTPGTGSVTYLSLRGKPMMCHKDPWGSLMTGLRKILKKEKFDLVIIDSIYQFQGEMDSNAANGVVRMMNQLKNITLETCQPAIIYVHHFAKGNPSLKTGLDRAAGSYAFNAAADSIMVVSPHEKAEHYICEFFLRHHKQIAPKVAKMRPDIKIMDVVDGEDPTAINSAWQESVTIGEEILRVMLTIEERNKEAGPIKSGELKTACRKRLSISDDRFKDAMAAMKEEEYVERHGSGGGLTFTMTAKGRETARFVEVTKAHEVSKERAEKEDKDDLPPEDPAAPAGGAVVVEEAPVPLTA